MKIQFKKIICYALYNLIAYHLPKGKNDYTGFFERIRAKLVRGYIDECGKNINIQRHAQIARRVKIGNYSGIGANSLIQGNVSIGNHVMMGPETYIYTQNHAFSRTDIPMDQQGFLPEKPVTIEDDVWIGARVTILPGVIIKRGSVIGAGSVVTKDVPEFSVAAGNPARIVKNRKE